ncbi:MAG: helix-turn-helix domain-containing protein [Cyclobacteriaceae bacterium]
MTKIKKAYVFRLKTNEEINNKLLSFAGCTRLVWNKLLGINLDRLKSKNLIIRYNEMAF